VRYLDSDGLDEHDAIAQVGTALGTATGKMFVSALGGNRIPLPRVSLGLSPADVTIDAIKTTVQAGKTWAKDAGDAVNHHDLGGVLQANRELEGRITMLAAVFVVPEDPESAAGEIEDLASELDEALQGGGCFAAGTQVLTAKGLRPIESLHVGDSVLARNQDTGEVAYHRIARTIRHENARTLLLTIADATGSNHVVEATPNHPFWVVGRGWTRADHLTPNAHLIDARGKDARVVSIHSGQASTTVFNLEVEQVHSYYVGAGSVLVHNAGNCGPVKVTPNPDAEGPHTVFKTDDTGTVTGYTTYDSNGNPVKRFRGSGRQHGGVDPPLVLEPKRGKGPGSPPKVPRKPHPDETPRGYE